MKILKLDTCIKKKRISGKERKNNEDNELTGKYLKNGCFFKKNILYLIQNNTKGGFCMALATITSRVDSIDKVNFDNFCDSVGLNASVAINMFIKTVLRERKIPFEIANPDPFYNAENQRILMQSVQQLRDGKGTRHELIEVD